jgi:hypothetical protein
MSLCRRHFKRMLVSATGTRQQLVPRHGGAARDTVAPARLELSLAFKAVGQRLALTAVGAEFHTPPRGELPAARPANCRRQGSRLRVAHLSRRRRRIRGVPRGRGRETPVRWSKRELLGRIERAGQLVLVQDDDGVLVPVDDRQVGIGTQRFGRKRRMNIVRLRAGEPALAGAQANENELVVLAGLELQSPTVGPVRKDRPTDLAQRERTPKPGRVGGCQVADHLTEKATQVLHG